MSCYKELLAENDELRRQLFAARLEIQGIKDSLSTIPEWVSTQEVLYQLDFIPLDPPFNN